MTNQSYSGGPALHWLLAYSGPGYYGISVDMGTTHTSRTISENKQTMEVNDQESKLNLVEENHY